jgi:hypothetical protein
MTVTAASKPREVTYFEMTGTASGATMRLTKPSVKALESAREVLVALSHAGAIFPLAPIIANDLKLFLANPTRNTTTETATAT